MAEDVMSIKVVSVAADQADTSASTAPSSHGGSILQDAAGIPAAAPQSERRPSRLSTLASTLMSPALRQIGSINDEMEDFVKHERELEAEGGDIEAPPAGLPAGFVSMRGLQIEDASNLGRFRVTKRAGVDLASEADVPVVVFLFGWLTCQDKHLYKYAQLYHKLGFPVVCRHTVPYLKVLRGGQRGVIKAAAEMVDIAQARFPRAKVVVSYYSNGGAFVHWRLLRLLKKRHRRQGTGTSKPQGQPLQEELLPSSVSTSADLFPQLAATIFDSAPVAADADAGAKAMSASMKSPALRLCVYSVVRFGLEVWGLVQLWQFERAFLREMGEDCFPSPSLYVYSEADTITDPAIVEATMAKRRAFLQGQGLDAERLIQGWKLRDSHHVCHYPHAPDDYRRRLAAFLHEHKLLP